MAPAAIKYLTGRHIIVIIRAEEKQPEGGNTKVRRQGQEEEEEGAKLDTGCTVWFAVILISCRMILQEMERKLGRVLLLMRERRKENRAFSCCIISEGFDGERERRRQPGYCEGKTKEKEKERFKRSIHLSPSIITTI